MCRAHGIGFDMKVITCCALVTLVFLVLLITFTVHFLCSMQWPVPLGFFFFQKVRFSNITSMKASSDSQGEAKSENTKSRLIICYFNCLICV